MRKIVQTAAVAMLAAGLLATPAAAQVIWITGNDWIAACTSGDPLDQIDCRNYTRGVADGLQLWQAVSPKTAMACIPEKLPSTELVAVAMGQIQANPDPEYSHLRTVVLLARAFKKAWPCNAPVH
jgi:Rap1a immunity proteins